MQAANLTALPLLIGMCQARYLLIKTEQGEVDEEGSDYTDYRSYSDYHEYRGNSESNAYSVYSDYKDYSDYKVYSDISDISDISDKSNYSNYFIIGKHHLLHFVTTPTQLNLKQPPNTANSMSAICQMILILF